METARADGADKRTGWTGWLALPILPLVLFVQVAYFAAPPACLLVGWLLVWHFDGFWTLLLCLVGLPLRLPGAARPTLIPVVPAFFGTLAALEIIGLRRYTGEFISPQPARFFGWGLLSLTSAMLLMFLVSLAMMPYANRKLRRMQAVRDGTATDNADEP